jgi:hypothetical protein
MKQVAEVAEWVQSETGWSQPVTASTRLAEDIGVYGDDWHELMEAYSAHFQVNMARNVWYFHTGEEGFNCGGVLFAAPYRRVNRIPVTVAMLCDYAHAGEWSIDYPQHELPRRRYDLLINRGLAITVFAGMLVFCVWKYLG